MSTTEKPPSKVAHAIGLAFVLVGDLAGFVGNFLVGLVLTGQPPGRIGKDPLPPENVFFDKVNNVGICFSFLLMLLIAVAFCL